MAIIGSVFWISRIDLQNFKNFYIFQKFSPDFYINKIKYY